MRTTFTRSGVIWSAISEMTCFGSITTGYRTDHEPLAVPRQTESADKSDALQTLRVVRRRPAVAKRLECVRLQRRFPKAGSDSMAGAVHGEPPFVISHALGP